MPEPQEGTTLEPLRNRKRDHPRRSEGLATRIVSHLHRNGTLVVLDVGILFVGYLAPLAVRFDGAVPQQYWTNFLSLLPLVVVVHLAANRVFGLYGEIWRYAGVHEARRVILSGGVAGGFVVATASLLGGRLRLLPLSVMALGATLSFIGFGAIRFQSRLFGFRRRSVTATDTRVLLVGAGDAGAMMLKDILANPGLGLHPVGFVDDDRRKVGRSLHDVPVLGRPAAIPELVDRLEVDQVLMTIPSATSEVVREIAALCEEADVPLRVVPRLSEVVGGRVTVKDIRDLRIEDLLGRQQVETDLDSVGRLLHGRRVLVTGAGGSIGSEICRQVAGFGPERLVLLDHDETHLHDAATDLGGMAGLEMVLADVRDRDGIVDVLLDHRPEIIFHAAAHKHVPLLEIHPDQAIQTNVIGTANVADAAVLAGVNRFVLISTDKAVNPVSMMGLSKSFAERIVRSFHGVDNAFCAVRFGNVLGSRGSVIPTFLRQIALGGPVTVTDPSMARYFMSIHEAVQLVLQAAVLAEGGEVFTLQMGEPVNIMDLARRLIRLSGRVPGRDVPITMIGPRPGEKIVEELIAPEEEPVPTTHPSIVVSTPPVGDRAELRHAVRELEALARGGDRRQLARRMQELAKPSLEPRAWETEVGA